ncbi:MAG: class I SAM-dependent methyltransferase [Promethearchaeota archaeon]|jgi:SAM-dependent methyltransferase
MIKDFYDQHNNFSHRTSKEYLISPGIRCKFDLIRENLDTDKIFNYAIDLGSSGNSVLFYLDNLKHKSFLDIADLPLRQYTNGKKSSPLCGDLKNLPYRDETFDLVSALDVLEHIKDDQKAVYELSRILKKSGMAIITVPHRRKFFTEQDRIIGHYRRYELGEIVNSFNKFNLNCVRTFGIYGQMMRISDFQSTNPSKVENGLSNLRERYETNPSFGKFWRIVVYILSKLMKVDAKYQSFDNLMNIGLIFKKA